MKKFRKIQQKEAKEIINIIIRYFILLLVALGNLAIFYFIFTPLTLYPIYWILNGQLSNSYLIISDKLIYLGPACIAGAAYYLLFILNLSTKMKPKKRIFSLLFLFFFFLILNILRILILTRIYIKQDIIFNLAHNLSWHLMSTIFVIFIWFANIKLFKIKQIPFYSDIKYILHLKKSKKTHQK